MKSKALSLAVALCLVALPALALADDEKEKNTSGSVTVGAQGGSGIEDSSKLQQFEVVPTGVFLEKAKFSWKDDAGYSLDLKATKLGLDDQYASLLWRKKDRFKLTLSWDQNPNWTSNTARTPFTETSPGVFRLPDGMRLALQNNYVPWVTPTTTNPIGTGTAPANPTVAGFFAVEPWVNNSQQIDLRYLRKTGRAGMSFKAGDYTTINVSYSKELRDGNKNLTFYGGPDYEIAAPIAYTTHGLRADADFAKGRWFANAAIDFSKFINDVQYAVIDNPERLDLANPAIPNARSVINDVTTFRLWLPPDNTAWTGDFTAGVTMPNRHKLTGAASFGSMKMDHELLALSTNPNLATSATAPNPAFSVNPPYSSVEARFDTLMGALRFTGDPSSKFGYIVSFRKFEMKDKTEEYEFLSSVRGDVGPGARVVGGAGEAGALIREHEGWAVQSIKGELHALPTAGLRLAVSYGQDKRDYDIREYADVKDDVFNAAVDYTHGKVGLHGSFNNLKRKPGDANSAAVPATWAGATQTDIVERSRRIFNGIFTLNPSDKVTISLTGQKQTNDFAESVTGLLDQSFDSFGADITYAPNEKATLWGGYVYEKYFFDMAAAYIPRGSNPPYDPANLWDNQTTDKVDTFRLGFRWTPKPDRFDLDASFDYSKPRSDSQYTFALPGTPAGGANEANGIFPANVPPVVGFSPVTSFSSFPLVSKKFTIAKIKLTYHIDKNLTASALWWWQKFDNVDWQTNNPGPNGEPFTPYMGRIDPGSNRWFFLGAQVPSYDANIFRASISYRF